jgi:hypothetical protein
MGQLLLTYYVYRQEVCCASVSDIADVFRGMRQILPIPRIVWQLLYSNNSQMVAHLATIENKNT